MGKSWSIASIRTCTALCGTCNSNSMGDYRYAAANSAGEILRGTLTAVDKQDLLAKLQDQDLFLIVDALVPETVRLEPPARPLPSMGVRRLGTALGVVLLVFAWQASHRPRHPLDTALLNEKLALLHVKMPRTDVERVLGAAYPGSPDPAKVWYAVPPQFILEVTYKKTYSLESQKETARMMTVTLLKSPKPL